MSSLGPNEERFAWGLARLAANDPTFTEVDFRGWGIGDEGVMRLVQALGGNTVVTHIYLQNNGISAALVLALVEVLENSTTLKMLSLSGNNFGDEGARAVATFLHNNFSLVDLYLRHCGIGVDGVRELARANSSTVTYIDLHDNSIGDVGVTVLVRVLPGNSTLTTLRLSDNEISDVGAIALAEVLPNNSSLTILHLGGNVISDVGGRLLATALLVNCTVTILNLTRSNISEALERLVDELAQINADASNPQEALGLKVEWLVNLDDGDAQLLGFEERGAKEKAMSLALDNLDNFVEMDQRQELFGQLLGSPEHGKNVANCVDITTARNLYQSAAECEAAPGVLMNLLRAHKPLCTCRDAQYGFYPFMLLATMPEAGVGDVAEMLQKDPTLVKSGICQTVTDNKRKRER